MTDKYKQIADDLKKEYFGIDQQIDDIVNTFEMWLTTKEYLIRPQILNLVGPSGLGKTAVIKEVINRLNLNDDKIYLKFNNKTTSVTEEFNMCTKSDHIFVLDEMQYIKSINENGEELREEDERGFNILWDLFDDGIISLQKYSEMYGTLYNTYSTISYLASCGVVYNKGIFTHRTLFDILEVRDLCKEPVDTLELFKKRQNGIIGLSYCTEEDPITYEYDKSVLRSNTEQDIFYLIGSSSLIRLADNINERTPITVNELRNFLLNCQSIDELCDFFGKVVKIKPKPTIKDLHNSLIITISNLDEAYKGITKQVGADGDLDADWYNRESKKISILQIRKALLRRFRAEQIARLGSKFVIYPMLSKNSFNKIIEKELYRFEDNIKSKFQNVVESVEFSNKIKQLIYAEGVFSPLGARCVFSTISEIVLDKFPNIIQSILSFDNGIKDLNILFDYNKRKKSIEIIYKTNSDHVILTELFPYKLKIDSLRCESKDNLGKQAHRAIHESGHAVCSIVLRKVFPEVIYSTLIESGNAFNMFNVDDFYMNRIDNYINDVAVDMAGYAAEEIIFGKENLSAGSSSDIRAVTDTLSHLYKDCGFGDKIGRFVSEQMPGNTMERDGNYCLIDRTNEFNDNIQDKIKEGLEIAKDVIINQKTLLLKMTEYLIKHPKMSNKKIKEYAYKYLVDFDVTTLEDNKTKFYLDIVNKELEQIKLK